MVKYPKNYKTKLFILLFSSIIVFIGTFTFFDFLSFYNLHKRLFLPQKKIYFIKSPFNLYLLSLNYFATGNNQKAIYYIKLALMKNPSNPTYWKFLSDILLVTKEKEKGDKAITIASEMRPTDLSILWNKANYALLIQNQRLAEKRFRKLLTLWDRSLDDIFDILQKAMKEDDIILNVIPENFTVLSRYLNYLIASNNLKSAKLVWERLSKYNKLIKPEQKCKFINFLIKEKKLQEAYRLWANIAHPQNSLIFDGDFECSTPYNSCLFNWQIPQIKGVKVLKDSHTKLEGEKSLLISFDGTKNPHLNIYQLVIIKPNTKYLFSGFIRTDNITTQNGLIVEIRDWLTKKIITKTPIFTETMDWKNWELYFKTDKNQNSILVSIKRYPSSKFDNIIEGKAWIDNITLKEIRLS